jgi:signal transduction histidine kinase
MMNQADRKTAPSPRDILAEEYITALRSYLVSVSEVALQRAYEVGRFALADGIGLLDMAILHHEALEKTSSLVLRRRDESRRLKAAAQFLSESLSPYEMAYRGFRERNAALRRINEVLEQEATRIARLLHDEAGQSLFAAHLSLADLEQKVDPSLLIEIRHIASVISQVEEQLRHLSHELRPTVLDDLGLVPALEFLAQGISRRNNIAVAVKALMKDRLPSSIEAVLFRVVQEALANVARHSNAAQAEVVLERKGQTLFCTVRDNGVGFDVEGWRNGTPDRGLGLIGIRERLDSIGGTLEMQSQPGQGTQLHITIPCEV